MKCDELEIKYVGYGMGFYPTEDVDAAIAELKAEVNRKEGVGKRWFERCMEARSENVRLKRALWLARAWFCGRSSEYFSGMASRCKIGQEDFYREVSERARRYMKSSYKCRAKAEQYKLEANK